MNKYLFCLIFLLIAGQATAQRKKSVILLIKSDSEHGTKLNGTDVLKVYQPVFEQDNTILRSDSAYFYNAKNAFDAFGHVVISQGDTVHVYADSLNYDGNTKIAILKNHVKMVNKDAVLTTDYFTYNTEIKFGTYTGGGRLVNKDNTLTSLNGYYFTSTRDAYFRYNVILNTVDAVIKTDTLRYNSGSRIAYFYGPTNIYGRKDKDTLYTENGLYNTITEQAFFGKKNLYKQGTKSLKGDSLFYDRLIGYGRAIKHITFNDNEQKITIKGNLAVYTKADERTVVTQNAYVILVTEDTVRTDNSLKNKTLKDTTLKDTEIMASKVKALIPKNSVPVKKYADARNRAKEAKAILTTADTMAIGKPKANVKRDSIFMSADTIQTRIVTFKALKELQEQQRLASIKDTLGFMSFKLKKGDSLYAVKPKLPVDTSFYHRDLFDKLIKHDTTTRKHAMNAFARRRAAERLKAQTNSADAIFAVKPVVLSDTARVRILSAARNAKMFKSDLQAKSDSIFYSYSDSTVRMYVHPIIWAEGSQLSGDTVYLQLKNKKFDNMLLFPNAFVVNIGKRDSAHFNQVGGKRMRAFFKDSKIYRVYVDGNAETIYFARDTSGNKVTELQRSISSRINVNFKDNEVSSITFISNVEHRYGPVTTFKENDRLLKGFIWKPKERPASKEAIIPQEAPIIKPGKKRKAVATKLVAKPIVLKTDSLNIDSVKAKADTLKTLLPQM